MNNTIKVCAWCNPGETILDRFPHWKGLGLEITHGICFEHRQQMLERLSADDYDSNVYEKARLGTMDET